ncbi:kinase-like domain-containing protein [Xylariales sp. PMI_506]|nr:kinase-like domain-containing protein [Xylariales sp. PMI_506]
MSLATILSPADAIKGDFNSQKALPISPEEVTKEWLSEALGFPVREVETVREIIGTAGKLLLRITYENAEEAESAGLPTDICLKGGFNPALTQAIPTLNETYRREAEFYYHIAPYVKMRLPRVWYCGSDMVTGQGLAAMANLEVRGCTFGSPTEPWPVERVHAGVEQLAALHAKTMGAKKEDYPWLYQSNILGENVMQGMILSLLSEPTWNVRFNTEGERPPVPESMVDRERMTAAWKTLWRTADPKFLCVAHGDSHIGNTFITPEGEPGFIDWQGLHACSALHDVAYFISGSLTVEDRREHEVRLLEHYIKRLGELGGPKFTREEVWDEYRKQLLHGFAWALTDPRMQSRENIFVMSERHATAIQDHKSLELLESLPEYKRE